MGRSYKGVRNAAFLIVFSIAIIVNSIIFTATYEGKIALLETSLLSSESLNEELEGQLDRTSNRILELQDIKIGLEDENAEMLAQIESLTQENNELSENNDELSATVEDLKATEYKLVYMGQFQITYYCTETYEHICNDGGSGLTSSGTTVTAGRTIATDTSIIPYGTKVYISGIGWRTAEDTGGAVNSKHIDVAVDSHEEAMSKGVVYKDVWILVKA